MKSMSKLVEALIKDIDKNEINTVDDYRLTSDTYYKYRFSRYAVTTYILSYRNDVIARIDTQFNGDKFNTTTAKNKKITDYDSQLIDNIATQI